MLFSFRTAPHGSGARRPGFRVAAIFLCCFLSGLATVALAQLPERLQAPRDFEFGRLIASYPSFGEIARQAREQKVTFGIYGGTVRDLYLGRKFTVISDFDCLYDASESGFPTFRNLMLEYSRSVKAGVPSPDFHFDLSSLTRPSERQRQYHEEGITATKVGVFIDGTMIDPTGYGIRDLRNRVFRFYPPDKPLIEIQNLGRFIRDLVRLPGFSHDPATLELMRRSLNRYRSAETPEGQKLRAAVAACRALPREKDWLTFPALINPFRQDLRWLHNGQEEKLSPCYPADAFLMELFRTVTQADDMAGMQAGFALFDLRGFMADVGLEAEGRLLTDAALTRDAVFDAFQFPGHWPENKQRETFLQQWQNTVRRYNYRVLLDMLMSEFSASSFEAGVLGWRKDSFLSPGSYRMMNPGPQWKEMLESLFDADFNLGTLPREKLQASLDWFLQTYLPLGETILKPVPVPANRRRDLLKGLELGFSPEVRSVPRNEPHSMKDVDSYISYLIGPELIPLYRDPRTSCAFLMADVSEAAAILAQLGYSQVFQINACGYNRRHRTLLGYNQKLDRVCIAQCAFYTDDQLLNQQARLYFLRRHQSEGGPGSVFVLRRPGTPFPAEEEFCQFLDNLHAPIDTFFIGFSNPLKKLMAGVRTVQIGDLDLKLGLMPEVDGCPRRLGLAMSAFGANYGLLPSRLVDILLKHDLKRVVLVGTGGGISRKPQRFGWIAPSTVAVRDHGSTGPWVSFTNLAATLDVKHLIKSGRHVSVPSPLFETQAEVRDLRRAGVVTVDCELAHLIRLLRERKNPVEVYALINVTDFPLGDERESGEGAIAVENASEQYQAVEEALKAIAIDITLRNPCSE